MPKMAHKASKLQAKRSLPTCARTQTRQRSQPTHSSGVEQSYHQTRARLLMKAANASTESWLQRALRMRKWPQGANKAENMTVRSGRVTVWHASLSYLR